MYCQEASMRGSGNTSRRRAMIGWTIALLCCPFHEPVAAGVPGIVGTERSRAGAMQVDRSAAASSEDPGPHTDFAQVCSVYDRL